MVYALNNVWNVIGVVLLSCSLVLGVNLPSMCDDLCCPAAQTVPDADPCHSSPDDEQSQRDSGCPGGCDTICCRLAATPATGEVVLATTRIVPADAPMPVTFCDLFTSGSIFHPPRA